MNPLQDLQELAAQLYLPELQVNSGTEAIWLVLRAHQQQPLMMCPQAMGPHPKHPPRGPPLAMFPTLPIGRPLQGAGLAVPLGMVLSPTAAKVETCRSALHHRLCTMLPKQSHDAADFT
jgi:hypothetical protein